MTSPQLENGYTRIANELLNALMKTYLSNYERRVLDCIIRYTYGFHKKKTKLSLTFIAKAIGIALPHISRTKKKLIARNMVTQTGNNELSLRKQYKKWVTHLGNLPKQVTKVTQTGNKNLPKRVTITSNPKDNIKKTIKYNNNASPEGDIVKNLIKEEDDKIKIRHPFQYLGLQIYDLTKAPKEKKSECMRIAKVYKEARIMASLSFARDYPREKLKWKMFLWKLHQLNKKDAKSS